METKPIRPKEDTIESAGVRRKFNTALDRLQVDCRNIRVYADNGGRQQAAPARRQVKLYGKAKWNE